VNTKDVHLKTKNGVKFHIPHGLRDILDYCACAMENIPLKCPINITLIIYLAHEQARHTKFGT